MEQAASDVDLSSESELNSQLKYVEGEELEKTWKSMRRERYKMQENNIWEQFCGDQDVVTTVSTDDPYQFIENIPEWQLQQLIQIEVEKVAKITQNVAEIASHEETGDGPPSVTCEANVIDEEHSDKEEALDIIKSPLSTVRECPSAKVANSEQNVPKPPPPPAEPIVTNERSESNVYYNKIKELREKITDAITGTLYCLDSHSFENIYSEDIPKLKKHALEFCMRFNRVFLYQIQRQICDVRRHDSHSLPFAKHTHFQAQMLRLTSLHKNILSAFNILNKTYMQTIMVGETPNQLRTLIANMKHTTQLCIQITQPIDNKIIHQLYYDDIIPSCETLEERLKEYEQNFKDVFHNVSQSINNKQQINIKKSQKNSTGHSGYAVNSFKSDVRTRQSKTSTEKTISTVNKLSKSSNSKLRKAEPKAKCQPAPPQNTKDNNKATTPKRNARSVRRPLMSFRGSRSPTHKLNRNNEDIQTLVQTVETNSKKSTPRAKTNPSRKKSITPRTPHIREDMSEAAELNENNSRTDDTEKQHNDVLGAGAEVSEILRLICKRDISSPKRERAKNVQLVKVISGSPRTPSEQLKILDEKIQKKYPRELIADKHLLAMNPTPQLLSHMEHYRSNYLQHMLSSPLYANTNFEKPWNLVAKISDTIIDDLICSCSQEMQLLDKITAIYNSEVV